jgi:hypothetical protein
VNWLTVSRHSFFRFVWLRNEEEARRFQAAMVSNEAFVEHNPRWPLMNSTRILILGEVSGLFYCLIHSPGDTASQILRKLPKLEKLQRGISPMSFDELSAVSKSLVWLECWKGFDFDTSIVDFSALIFPRMEEVLISSRNDSALQFIVNVLKTSIPQGRGCLKRLKLYVVDAPVQNTNSVDYIELGKSLIKVIEV